MIDADQEDETEVISPGTCSDCGNEDWMCECEPIGINNDPIQGW